MNHETMNWVPDWMAHLQREENLLVEALASVRQVGKALMTNDRPTLEAALSTQTGLLTAAKETQAVRARLRANIAGALNLAPQAVTIKLLAQHLPGATGELLAHSGQRLGRLAKEVERQNHRNGLLVHHSLRFLRQLLGIITRSGAAGERYSAAGTHQQMMFGSILNARG
jgi:hypothetical protein